MGLTLQGCKRCGFKYLGSSNVCFECQNWVKQRLEDMQYNNFSKSRKQHLFQKYSHSFTEAEKQHIQEQVLS